MNVVKYASAAVKHVCLACVYIEKHSESTALEQITGSVCKAPETIS